MKKYYELLEVNENVSELNLKIAFSRKFKIVKPFEPEGIIPYAEAYVVLHSPIEKKKYDETPEDEYDFSKHDRSVPDPGVLSRDLVSQYYGFLSDRKAYMKMHFVTFLGGLLMFLAGTVITIGTLVSGARVFVVLYGLIVTGLGTMIKGLVSFRKSVKSIEDKWSALRY